MDKTAINKRFKKVVDFIISSKITSTKTKLAENLGVKYGILAEILAGRMNASVEIIASLCKFYKISTEYMLFGRGDMLLSSTSVKSPEKSMLHEPEAKYNSKIEQTNDTSIGIPLIPLDALAGLPVTDNIGVAFIDCEHYIVPEFQSKGVEFMIRVSGSSMYPKYSNGDLLACRRITDILFFQWGKIYVIDSSQGVLVKRVFEDTNPDNILLVSDNKEKYPPFSFPKSDIRSLSIVLGVIRLE